MHYFDLNNISKLANSEKRLLHVKEHYKEFTFKPKINPESAAMDYNNLTQVYYKMQRESMFRASIAGENMGHKRDRSSNNATSGGMKLNQTL